MCTALTYGSNPFYFGRNLDLEYTYDQKIVITPRNYPFTFRNGSKLYSHYAMIGMAAVSENFPLYFEATNEKGLSIAGLNFPGNACYFPYAQDKINIAPFELIPWILGKCASVTDAKSVLGNMNLWKENFSKEFPISPLHWIIADSQQAITLESTKNGLHIINNSVGILTNNPTFDYHMTHLSTYLNITAEYPTNRFSEENAFEPFSLGMGAMGLPGDPSSPSRFVRAAFVKCNSTVEKTEELAITQFFHILGSVSQQKGVTKTKSGQYEYTLYSSCCNTNTGIYYYTTYTNSRICGVNMHQNNLDIQNLICYPLITEQDICMQNESKES